MAGPAVTGLALHRLSLLELGLQAGAVGLYEAQLSLGVLGGLRVGETWSLRVLGAAGLHFYRNVGTSVLSEDPGADDELAYVGARLVLGYSFSRRARAAHRAFIGVVASVDEDLGRESQTVHYTRTPWLFGGEPEQRSSTHRLGQTTFAGLLLVGVELELLP